MALYGAVLYLLSLFVFLDNDFVLQAVSPTPPSSYKLVRFHILDQDTSYPFPFLCLQTCSRYIIIHYTNFVFACVIIISLYIKCKGEVVPVLN